MICNWALHQQKIYTTSYLSIEAGVNKFLVPKIDIGRICASRKVHMSNPALLQIRTRWGIDSRLDSVIGKLIVLGGRQITSKNDSCGVEPPSKADILLQVCMLNVFYIASNDTVAVPHIPSRKNWSFRWRINLKISDPSCISTRKLSRNKMVYTAINLENNSLNAENPFCRSQSKME